MEKQRLNIFEIVGVIGGVFVLGSMAIGIFGMFIHIWLKILGLI